MLLIEVGALLFLLGLLGRLSRRFGLSPIPLYLLAGLAFGHGGLLPLDASEEFFEVGAEIGVILLLVMLGLEYSADELVGNLRVAGAGRPARRRCSTRCPAPRFALLLGWGWVAAVVLAGITWVSSSGVIAKVLGDLGRLGNRETPVILSVLVIEDLAMALYLPLLTALLAGAGLARRRSGARHRGARRCGVVLVVAIRYGGVISNVISARDPEALLLGVFGLTLLVAGVAAQLQVSAAVGAFLVGIALSGPVAHHATAAAGAAARPVRRGLLRVLRPDHRPGRHPAGAAAGARARRASRWRRRCSPDTSPPAGPGIAVPRSLAGRAGARRRAGSSRSSSPGSRSRRRGSSRGWRRSPPRTC